MEPTDISIPTEELEEAINIAYKDDETRNNNEEIKEPKKHAKKKEQSNEPIETKQKLIVNINFSKRKVEKHRMRRAVNNMFKEMKNTQHSIQNRSCSTVGECVVF